MTTRPDSPSEINAPSSATGSADEPNTSVSLACLVCPRAVRDRDDGECHKAKADHGLGQFSHRGSFRGDEGSSMSNVHVQIHLKKPDISVSELAELSELLAHPVDQRGPTPCGRYSRCRGLARGPISQCRSGCGDCRARRSADRRRARAERHNRCAARPLLRPFRRAVPRATGALGQRAVLARGARRVAVRARRRRRQGWFVGARPRRARPLDGRRAAGGRSVPARLRRGGRRHVDPRLSRGDPNVGASVRDLRRTDARRPDACAQYRHAGDALSARRGADRRP